MTDPAASTTDDFAVASAVERAGDGRFRLRVPDGWQQGRGAFGGLVLGALVRAVEASEPDAERAVRALSGEITGPVLAGEAAIEVAALRRGAHVSTWSASLVQGGEVLGRASVVLGRARPVDRAIAPAPPTAERGFRPFDEGLAMDPSIGFGPAFARHYEYRLTGPMPFSAGPEPIAAGWVRARRPPPVLGAAELTALADVWWPAIFSVEEGPRPTSTITFTLQLPPTRGPLPGDRPLFHCARVLGGGAGYLAEQRELWTEGGELVALNTQTFVVIK